MEEISHIDSVTYDLESEDYNKDNYTKYDLTVSGAYGSEEESAVEADLETEFQDYMMAIVMNLGTNLLLGTVSSTTSSLGPILQLVLSMDYSVAARCG